MRITPSSQQRTLLEALRNVRERLASHQGHLASGRRVEKPSDDPGAAGEAVGLRSRIAALDRFAANASSARALLGTAEGALNGVVNLLTQAKAEAVRGASSALGAQARADIAVTVDSLQAQVYALARTQYLGRYIFSGTATRTDPFDASGTYQGNTGTIPVETGTGSVTASNVAGSDVFGSGAGSVFDTLGALATALRADDTAGIQAAIGALDAAFAQVSSVRTDVGARQAAIESVAGRDGAARIGLISRLSEIEDADIVALVTDITLDQTAEQATLATTAQLSRRSLFDYLG